MYSRLWNRRQRVFKKFKDSPYWKAAMMMLLCGGILIMFNNWVKNTKFSVGFDTLNKTLAPIYIGCICAFILCPIYNAIVRASYNKMLTNAMSGTTGAVGTKMVRAEGGTRTVDGDEKRRLLTMARAFASIVCVVILVGIIALFIYFVVPQVIASGVGLMETLPQRLSALSGWTEQNFSRFPIVVQWVDSIANAGTSDIINWVQEHILQGNAANLATAISSGVYTAVKYVANAFVGLLIMVYLLNYKERLFAICRKFVAATCSKRRQDALFEFADIVNETFIGFIVGRIIDSFIIGVLTFIVMVIIGMPFASMIAVIVGVTNVIPFFGPFIGAIPSFFILMLEDPTSALEFVIMIIIIQQLDGNVIGPKIVGNALGISSFWVLIAVLIGGGLFGFGGMALGVPVFAVIYRYVNKVTTKSLQQKEKATETMDYLTLEQYGIDTETINLNPPKKDESIFSKRKKKRTEAQNAVKAVGSRLPKIHHKKADEVERVEEEE